MASIKLFKGQFGHVSVLNAASDLVTHAHPEAHVIVWLDGDPGRMVVGETEVVSRRGQACLRELDAAAQPSLSATAIPAPSWPSISRPNGRRCGWAAGPANRCSAEPRCLSTTACALLTATLFEHLMCGYDSTDFAAYEIERMIDHLIDGIEVAQSKMPTPADGAGRLDHRVRKALAVMQANMSGRLGLDEVARSVGLSRPHFFALFKEQMNLTPNVYWNTLRMEEALRQLQWSQRVAHLGRLQSRLHHAGQFHALLPRPCRRAADALSRGGAAAACLTLFQTASISSRDALISAPLIDGVDWLHPAVARKTHANSHDFKRHRRADRKGLGAHPRLQRAAGLASAHGREPDRGWQERRPTSAACASSRSHPARRSAKSCSTSPTPIT